MGRANFIGSSYTSQSPNADCQATINWYEETIESGMGKGAKALYPTPGLKLFTTIGAGPVSAEATINGRTFFVSGNGFYEANAAGVVQNGGNAWGAVANDGKPAYIAASTTQVVIAAGKTAYLFTLATNTFQAIANLAGIQVARVEIGDRFFFALQSPAPNVDPKVYSSNAGDGSTWNLLNFAAPSVYPDNTLGMIADHRELILTGAKGSVAYYDSGGAQFPYDVVPGGYLETGIAAPASMTRIDNSTFWWAADERGAGVAIRLQGYLPVRISNHAIEFAVQGYSTIADAVSYAYQDQGHTFWVTYFPSANGGNGVTWVYDVATQQWHQRAFWNAHRGAYDAHRSRCHVYAFGKHLVGDWATGNVYQMAIPVVLGAGWDFVTDFGQPIVRDRIAPVLSLEDEWMFFDKIVIDAEVGLGPQPPLTQAAPYPQAVTLQDANGVLWNITVTDAGLIQTAHAPVGTPVTPLTLNDTQTAKSWAFGVTIAGAVTLASVQFSALNGQVFPMGTAGTQLATQLTVANGFLQTAFPVAYPRDPQGILRWSNDAAKTYNEPGLIMNFGQAGNFLARAVLHRLGKARKGRVFRFTVSDPVPWRIVEGYIYGSGFGPVERLPKQLAQRA